MNGSLIDEATFEAEFASCTEELEENHHRPQTLPETWKRKSLRKPLAKRPTRAHLLLPPLLLFPRLCPPRRLLVPPLPPDARARRQREPDEEAPDEW